MKTIIMECPGCKANLEIDKERMIAFCPYCGKKIIYDIDGLSYIITEQEKTKQITINNKYELEKIKTEHEEKRKDDLHDNITIIIALGLMIVFPIIIQLLFKLF